MLKVDEELSEVEIIRFEVHDGCLRSFSIDGEPSSYFGKTDFTAALDCSA